MPVPSSSLARDLRQVIGHGRLVSQIWNAVINSMYRRHLLSIDHVQQLLCHLVLSDTNTERRTLWAPAFFMSQGDRGFKGYLFPHGSEAMRRISFFAQSLTTHIPEQYGRSSSWRIIILKRFLVFTWYYQGRRSIYSSHTSRVLEALTSSWMGQPC